MMMKDIRDGFNPDKDGPAPGKEGLRIDPDLYIELNPEIDPDHIPPLNISHTRHQQIKILKESIPSPQTLGRTDNIMIVVRTKEEEKTLTGDRTAKDMITAIEVIIQAGIVVVEGMDRKVAKGTMMNYTKTLQCL